MSQPARQKPKIWLVPSSPDDSLNKTVSERMGMTVADFMSALVSEPDTRSKQSSKRFVWPRHTKHELHDPMQMVYRHDPSDKSWSLQYKALGCYEYVLLTLTPIFSRGTPKQAENLAASLIREKCVVSTQQLNSRALVDPVKENRFCGKQTRETITPAQQKELRQALALSDSGDSDSDPTKFVAPKVSPQTSIKPASYQCQKLLDSVEKKVSGVIPMVSPLRADSVMPRSTPRVNVSKQHRDMNGFASNNADGGLAASVDSTVSGVRNSVKMESLKASRECSQVINQNNLSSSTLSSSEKQKRKIDAFMQRVLSEADAFCKPLLHLPGGFLDDTTIDEEVAGGELENVPSGDKFKIKQDPNHYQRLVLKRVSPLPNIYNFEAAKDEPSPPIPKKPRKYPLESLLVAPTPIPPKYIKPTFPSSSKPTIKTPDSPAAYAPLSQPVHITRPGVTVTPQQPLESSQSSVHCRVTRDPWITPLNSSVELRSRISAVITPTMCTSPAAPSDKLTSLRFILRSLRLPSEETPSRPNFRGILLAPGSSSKKSKRPIPTCANRGVETSLPKRSAIGVQWEPCDGGGTANSYTQVSPRICISSVTNTTPPWVTTSKASACVGTENTFGKDLSIDKCSMDECLNKILEYNQEITERTVANCEQSTEEQELTRATALDAEASQCWSQLVAYVAATSGSSSTGASGAQHHKPFVCPCSTENTRLTHSLFNQTDFTTYPERVLASTRHLLVWAHMSTSVVESKRRYDQALAGLAKTASRMRRAESKLIRRAWMAIQRGGGSGSDGRSANTGPPPISEVAQLGAEAKRWSDLWYSALTRVNSVVTEKVYQLLAEKEHALRLRIDEDESLQRFRLLKGDDHFLLGDSPSGSLGQVISPSPNLQHRTSTPASSSSTNDRSNATDLQPYSLGTDSSKSLDVNGDPKSVMCTLPRTTLERLLKVFQMTSLAHESWKARLESEQILQTDPFVTFGFSSSESLPVYIAAAPAKNIDSLIVYIDNVIQRHRRLVALLAACPGVPVVNCQISPPPSVRSKPLSVVTKRLQPPPPTSPIKRKRAKSPSYPPPPPPFEALPVRPVKEEKITKKHKHRQPRDSAAGAVAASSEASVMTNSTNRLPKIPKKKPAVVTMGVKEAYEQRHDELEPLKVSQEEPSRSARKERSRSRSVAPLRREASESDGERGMSSLPRSRREREHKMLRGCSVMPNFRDKVKGLQEPRSSDIPAPAQPSYPYLLDTHSPAKNASSIDSYSPTRPSFTNEAMHPNHSSQRHPAYIPTAPTSMGTERRGVLHELPSKSTLLPTFSSKWLDGGSSNSRR